MSRLRWRAASCGTIRSRRRNLPTLPEALTPDGYLRTLPGMWAEHGGMDGFFAARLIKT